MTCEHRPTATRHDASDPDGRPRRPVHDRRRRRDTSTSPAATSSTSASTSPTVALRPARLVPMTTPERDQIVRVLARLLAELATAAEPADTIAPADSTTLTGHENPSAASVPTPAPPVDSEE